MTIVEMHVRIDCTGCERKIRKALSQLEGVDNVEIDMGKQKVTVTGYAEAKKVLKAVRRTGKKAEFWLYPYHREYNPYVDNYYEKESYSSSYNYYKHGYNGSRHGYYQTAPFTTIVDDEVSVMFSDENPLACSVM